MGWDGTGPAGAWCILPAAVARSPLWLNTGLLWARHGGAVKRLDEGRCVISNAAGTGNSSTQDRRELLYGRRWVLARTAEGPKLRGSAVKVDERGMDEAPGY